jgi:hypothetical protein
MMISDEAFPTIVGRKKQTAVAVEVDGGNVQPRRFHDTVKASMLGVRSIIR